MALVKWNAWRDLATIQNEMNRFFNGGTARYDQEDFLTGSWIPQVDIFEDEDHIKVLAALPGMKQKEINVNIENNVLTISGERKLENEDKRDNYARVEQHYGSFSRSFSLPNTIDAGKVEASMDKGILTVNLPKREEAKPKLIEVKIN